MDVDKDLVRQVKLLREKTGYGMIDCRKAIKYAYTFGTDLRDEALVNIAEKYIKDHPFCLPTG